MRPEEAENTTLTTPKKENSALSTPIKSENATLSTPIKTDTSDTLKQNSTPAEQPFAGHKGVERITANLGLSIIEVTTYTDDEEKVPYIAPNWLIGEIKAIQAYYETAQLPTAQIWLGEGEFINDVRKFTSAHLEYLTGTSAPRAKLPYLDHLKLLKVLVDVGYPAPPF